MGMQHLSFMLLNMGLPDGFCKIVVNCLSYQLPKFSHLLQFYSDLPSLESDDILLHTLTFAMAAQMW
jgi:hypothetical protein